MNIYPPGKRRSFLTVPDSLCYNRQPLSPYWKAFISSIGFKIRQVDYGVKKGSKRSAYMVSEH
jgi:hypothetical protein